MPVNKTDYADVVDPNSNMPDYFRFSINREADKRANQVLKQNIQNEFSDVVFQEFGVLKVCLAYR